MATKSSQPALYEKLRGRSIPVNMGGNGGLPSRKVDVTPEGQPLEAEASWARPGRVIRVPVGFVLLAVALAILLAMVAYATGHNRGEKTAKAIYDNEIRSSMAAPTEPLPETVDPLVNSLAEQTRVPANHSGMT